MEKMPNPDSINSAYHYRGYLITEEVNVSSESLELISTESMVRLFNQEDLKPQIAVSKVCAGQYCFHRGIQLREI